MAYCINGEVGGRELEYHRAAAAVGQIVVDHIYCRTYVVYRLIEVLPPIELQRHDRDIVFRLRCNFFESVDGVERVFEYFGNVGLYLGAVGTTDRKSVV